MTRRGGINADTRAPPTWLLSEAPGSAKDKGWGPREPLQSGVCSGERGLCPSLQCPSSSALLLRGVTTLSQTASVLRPTEQ